MPKHLGLRIGLVAVVIATLRIIRWERGGRR